MRFYPFVRTHLWITSPIESFGRGNWRHLDEVRMRAWATRGPEGT